MMKVSIRAARCRCAFDFYQDGSVLRGTLYAEPVAFRTHLAIESDEPEAVIAKLIRMAKRSCFAERLIETKIDIESTFEVNGVAYELPPA